MCEYVDFDNCSKSQVRCFITKKSAICLKQKLKLRSVENMQVERSISPFTKVPKLNVLITNHQYQQAEISQIIPSIG